MLSKNYRLRAMIFFRAKKIKPSQIFRKPQKHFRPLLPPKTKRMHIKREKINFNFTSF